jgi:hypothetical protein
VPSATLSDPHPVNPGTHEIVAVSTDGTRAATSVDLKESESRGVDLSVAPPSGAPSSPSSAPGPSPTQTPPIEKRSGPSGTPLLVYGGFGLAAAGIAVGTVTGIVALGKGSSVSNACRNTLDCPESVVSDLNTGRTMAAISTVSFACAGAGAVAGVLALVLGHKKEAAPAAAWIAPWAGPGAAGISGATSF